MKGQQISTKEIIKYYAMHRANVKNDFELNNILRYYYRIRSHQHIFVQDEKNNLYCIGCSLSSIYKDCINDELELLNILYQEAIDNNNYILLNDNKYNFDEIDEIKNLYTIHRYLGDNIYDIANLINKELKINKKALIYYEKSSD